MILRLARIRFKRVLVTDSLLIAAAACAIAGPIVLRVGWSLPKRSILWNVIGWGLLLVASVAAWSDAGAWGAAVTALWAMGAALILLAQAAISTAPVSNTKASNRRANMLPQSGEPLFLRRRFTTFFVVILAAMVVSIGWGIATRIVSLLLGASEANANVLALFAMPLLWVWLSYALLMEHRRTRQWIMLLLWAAPGGLAVITGLAA